MKKKLNSELAKYLLIFHDKKIVKEMIEIKDWWFVYGIKIGFIIGFIIGFVIGIII